MWGDEIKLLLENHVMATHAWGKDGENHKRVVGICADLIELGAKVWIDEHRMYGNIPKQMVDGIDNSHVVVVFITKDYMEKVNLEGEDNCKLEFTYAMQQKGAKNLIPVVMEPGMLDTSKWKGLLSMYLGQTLYVDMSTDELAKQNMGKLVDEIKKRMADQGFKFKPKRLSVATEASSSSRTEASKDVQPFSVEKGTQGSENESASSQTQALRKYGIYAAVLILVIGLVAGLGVALGSSGGGSGGESTPAPPTASLSPSPPPLTANPISLKFTVDNEPTSDQLVYIRDAFATVAGVSTDQVTAASTDVKTWEILITISGLRASQTATVIASFDTVGEIQTLLTVQARTTNLPCRESRRRPPSRATRPSWSRMKTGLLL